ncbi:MAG TPA: PPOX class F420-dependent oxidoreductase [Candidatus Sulfotelmatobacter sp.]|jgi:hypothetical protein|nr:PPOX class F420-dependent oxidoreductase [Candidatus Sulfotelmatobacter sp.]
MDIPDDVVRWVTLHFKETESEQALSRLRSAKIHTGEPAGPRLLRCVAVSSGGNLRQLDQGLRQLGVDWRDVIVHAEYIFTARGNVRVRDFDNPMDAQTNLIPLPIQGQKYISLTTFRKTGAGVATPVWFGEEDGKLYVMTISKMGKVKRIRNNPQVQVAPCTMRGKVTGEQFPATARLLAPEDFARARKTITRKYWLAWISTPFSRADAFIELSFA